MNKLFTFLFILISVTVISQNRINLNYKLQTGDSYHVTTDIFSQSTQEVAGSPQEVSIRQQIKYNLLFSKNNAASGYNISLKFIKITSSVNQSGYKQFFSSDSSDNNISKLFHQFLSETLNYQLTEKGKLSAKYTIDSLFPDSSEAKQRFIFSESVEQKVSNDLPVSIVFPDSLISENMSWTVTDTIKSGIFKFYNQIYTLDSVSETEYFISKQADFSSDKNNLIPMNKVYITYNVSGQTFTDYVLDKNTCVIKTGQIKQTGKGPVNMKYTENSDPAYTWNMEINNIIKFTSEKQKPD